MAISHIIYGAPNQVSAARARERKSGREREMFVLIDILQNCCRCIYCCRCGCLQRWTGGGVWQTSWVSRGIDCSFAWQVSSSRISLQLRAEYDVLPCHWFVICHTRCLHLPLSRILLPAQFNAARICRRYSRDVRGLR